MSTFSGEGPASRTRVGAHGTAAPVLLVATRTEGHAPDLPLADLRRDYPNIVGYVAVDAFAKDDTGIDGLRALIAEKAASLPLMGSTWPSSWLAAQRACRESEHTHLRIDRFRDLLAANGIRDATSQEAVTGVLDKLGEILHYPEDKDLAATVVLKPQWLSERIAAILDSPRVAGRHGLLTTRDIEEQWPDLDTDLRSQILAMMDRYDVSYRIAESAVGDDARAIIVDRLPWEPPEYTQQWEQALTVPQGRRLRLDYRLGSTVPPGIPGWFIARAHRFATTGHRPWRDGVLLAHPDGAHLGRLYLDRADGTVHLEVRGPRPAGFLGMLDLYFLDAVLRRYPGLAVTRSVPCGCRPSCPTSWPYDKLVRLHDTLGQSTVQCIESGIQLSIADLIDGIAPSGPGWGSADADLSGIARRLDELTIAVMRSDARQSEYAAQLHLEFAKVMGWLRVTTPAVFTVTNSRRVPGVHRYTLRLYCAEPTAIHLLPGEEGCYEFTGLERWAGALLRHLTTVAGLLSHIAGLTGDILGMSARDLLGRSSEDLKNMGELLEHLKATGESLNGHATESDLPRDRAGNDSDARAVEQLLHHLDPSQRWGGLSKTTTPAGLTLYLCADHEAAYRSPSPRPHGI